jgi:DNA-binding LacI/PurR family transcriptional regulator
MACASHDRLEARRRSGPSKARALERPKQLYQAVKDSIMQSYVRPLLETGGTVPSDRRLAAEYEVNVGTVNKAIHELAREGLVERRVGSGTRVVPRAVPAPGVGVYFGGMIIDGSRENAVYGRLDEALQRELAGAGRGVRHYVDMRIDEFQGEPLPELVDDVRGGRLTSLIVARANPAEYGWLRELELPVVCNNVDCGRSAVRYGLRSAARRAARHLLSEGCSRLALVSPDSANPGGREGGEPALLLGMKEALAESGASAEVVEADTSVPDVSDGRRAYPEDRGYAALERLWAGKPRPDGLVVFPDVFALGIVRAAEEFGVALGDEVRLVAFANREQPWPELEPFAQVRLPMRRVARALLDLALRLERGEEAEDILVPLTFHPGPGRRRRRRRARS